MFLLITYHLLLGLVLSAAGTIEDHKYCVSDSPLYTPYFIPFYKTVQPALGCVSRPSSRDKTEVHVVRLAQPAKDVFIYVTGSSNQTDLSLVLASSAPVTWHLAMSGYNQSSRPNILISDGSHVIDTATGEELATTAAILRTESITLKLAKTQFSAVHTFTSITAANRIFIRLSPELASQSACDIATRDQSSAVEAFYVQRQNTFGCYHQEAAGLLPNDVHVIDLKEKVVKRSTATDSIEDVVLEVSPDKTEIQDEGLLPRNLTLILKSDKPVKWVIKSKGIKGQLIVAAGHNEVESVSDNSEQSLEIREADIPDSFDSLIREVTSNYGLPLSYIRVHQANLLEMVIPPRSKRELASMLDFESNQSKVQPDAIDLEEDSYDAAEQIEKVMIKECNEEHKSISVKIPVDIIAKFGITSMTLNDPNCVPVKDLSYWSFSSHSTQCGSLALTYGSSPMYRNNVNIQFGRGSLAGQRAKVPFICKFKPGIPGFPTVPDYYDENEEEDSEPSHISSEEEEMYRLKVELATEGGERKATLLDLKSDSATAAVGDNIIVSSHIDAVPYLALSMEQCWISNSSQISTHASATDQLMITSGCPTSSHVSLHWQIGTANSAFSFKITKELIAHKKVWIQCRMGLCSATKAGAKGNIKRCIDPEYDCAANHQHRESSLQQISIRGPLHILPVARDDLEKPMDKEPMTGEKDYDDKGFATKTSHTLVEVPVEVAVAIALASFIVGAMSTGVLWFLHSKAMQAKSRRLNRGCDGTELQSMLRPSVGQVSSNGSLHHRSQQPEVTGSHDNGDMNANCTVCPLI